MDWYFSTQAFTEDEHWKIRQPIRRLDIQKHDLADFNFTETVELQKDIFMGKQSWFNILTILWN